MAIILCCHLWLVICNILVIFLIHSSAGSQGEAHSSIVASAKTSSLPVSTLVKKPLPTIELAVEADGISLKKRGKQVKVVINTVSREIDVIGIPKRTLKHKSRMYYAIFGHFTLPLGDYLLLVSDAQTVQNIHVDSIQEVKGFELVKIPGSGKSAASLLLQPKLLQEHRKAVKELFFALRRHTFHFSTGKYNILRTVQSNHLNYPGAEDKFFWNKMALSPFISTNATDFITPLCNSWIGSAVIEEADNRYRVTLISRRSKDRQGPR